MATLILFNKPYQVLSQFTDKSKENNGQEQNRELDKQEFSKRKTLASYIEKKSVYPAGRLDFDSEGLLILTDSGVLQSNISDPKYKLSKTYWVQVEGAESSMALEQLANGVDLKDGKTRPAKVKVIPEPDIWERLPAVRNREHIPTHWLEIEITEGRNRQVRRMTASVGLPTLRLIRYRIGDWSLDGIAPGEHRELSIHVPVSHKNNKFSSAKRKKHGR